MFLLLAIGARTSAQENAAFNTIARVSEVYRGMQPSLMMKAEIWRHASKGQLANVTKRRYRLILAGPDARLDLIAEADNSVISRMRRHDNIILYSSALKKFTEQPETDPRTGPIRDVLEQFLVTLYARFVDLAASNPLITSAKPDMARVGRLKKACLHVKLRSRDGGPRKWSGEIWVDRETALVWRANMSVFDNGESVEEAIQWEEIVTGPQVPVGELDWQPPPGTQRIPYWTHTLPR